MLRTLSFLCLAVAYSAGYQTCLSCRGAVQPRDCETITRCGFGESCYTESVITSLGFVRFNMGCRDDQQCKSTPTITRRFSDSGLTICMECCTGELCNNEGCGAVGYPSATKRGPLCYSCQEQARTDDCHLISLCGAEQVCQIRSKFSHVTSDQLYTSGCTDVISACPLTASQRTTGTCNQCCMGDLCNNKCNLTNPTPPPLNPTTSSTGTTTSDPCAPNPCVSGSCVPYLGTYRCFCDHDAFGRNCDQYVNHCVTQPCVNGTCQSITDSYTCTCSPGYTGTDCDTAIDYCLSNPCQYGNCSSTSQGFNCSCYPGYQGSTCDTGSQTTTTPPTQGTQTSTIPLTNGTNTTASTTPHAALGTNTTSSTTAHAAQGLNTTASSTPHAAQGTNTTSSPTPHTANGTNTTASTTTDTAHVTPTTAKATSHQAAHVKATTHHHAHHVTPTTVKATTHHHAHHEHCKRPADCKLHGLPDGDYQSCTGCNHYLTCASTGAFDRPCPPFEEYDSRLKICVTHSTTCRHH